MSVRISVDVGGRDPAGVVDTLGGGGDTGRRGVRERSMSWNLKGDYVETCSCELMCPCNLSLDHGGDV
jgi:hypothetical protein